MFKDNASYICLGLVAANAVFSDLGDLRKPEYPYQIVQDALWYSNDEIRTLIEEWDKIVRKVSIR